MKMIHKLTQMVSQMGANICGCFLVLAEYFGDYSLLRLIPAFR